MVLIACILLYQVKFFLKRLQNWEIEIKNLISIL